MALLGLFPTKKSGKFPNVEKSAPEMQGPVKPASDEMSGDAKTFFENLQHKVFAFIDGVRGAPLQRFEDYDSYLRAASKKVWISYRCAKLKAHLIATTEMQLITEGGVEVKKNPLLDLLKRPNPYDTIETFFMRVAYHLQFTGTAYILKDAMTLGGQPTELYVLNPARMIIHPDPKKMIAKYEYRVSGTSYYYTPEEVVRIVDPHPSHEILGWGDFEGGEALLQEFVNRQALHEALVENGGIPSGILVSEDPALGDDEKEWKKKRARWVEEYTGKSRNGKIAWLAGKWSYLKLGMTIDEAKDIERSKLTVEQICALHGVPKSLVLAEAANYATSRQDEINFRKYTGKPLIELIVGALNVDLVPLFGKNLLIDFLLSGLIDVEQVGKDYEWLFDRGGCTRNDLRRFSGLKAVKNDPSFDSYFFKDRNGYIPADMVGLQLEQALANPNPGLPNDPASGKPPKVPANSQRN